MTAQTKPPNKDMRRFYGEYKTSADPHKVGKHPLLISKSNFSDSEREFEEQVRYLENRKDCKQDNLVELVYISKKENRGMCSNSFSLAFGFEFHLRNVDVEFENRKLTGGGFSGDELLSIVSSTVAFTQQLAGLRALHRINLQHGNLRPEYLLLPPAPSALPVLKILDNLIDRNGKLLSSQKFNISHKSPLYLSPDYFDFVVNGVRLPTYASPSW